MSCDTCKAPDFPDGWKFCPMCGTKVLKPLTPDEILAAFNSGQTVNEGLQAVIKADRQRRMDILIYHSKSEGWVEQSQLNSLLANVVHGSGTTASMAHELLIRRGIDL